MAAIAVVCAAFINPHIAEWIAVTGVVTDVGTRAVLKFLA